MSSKKTTRKEKQQRKENAEENSFAENETVQNVAGRPNRKLLFTLAGIIFVVAILLYANTFHHDYVLDDYSQIKSNRVTKEGIKAIPTILKTSYRYGIDSGDDELYRPLSMVLFATEWSLWPDSPHKYHVVNVLLYAIMSVMLFFTLNKIFEHRYLAVSFVSSLLFIAHPLHTEVVANIKSGDEILGFIFMLSTIYLLLNHVEKTNGLSLALSIICMALALLSKENSIVLIAIIPLLLFLFRTTSIKNIILTMIPFFAITVVYLFIRSNILHGFNGSGNVVPMDNALVLAENKLVQITSAIAILGKYIWLCIFPKILLCDYSYNHILLARFGDSSFLIAFIVCAGSLGYAMWVVIKNFMERALLTPSNIIAFGILFFFIGIFPTANILVVIRSTMAERFAFMPLLGFCIVISMALVLIFKKLNESKISYSSLSSFCKANASVLGIATVITLLYSVKTIQRNGDWKNEDILYPVDILKAPNNAKLHYYYANHFVSSVKEGKVKGDQVVPTLDKAIAKAERSVQLLPKYYESFFVLGEAYGQKGDYPKSLENYQKAWHLGYPGSMVLNNMGNVFFKMQQYDTAIVYLNKGLVHNPNNVQTWTNLGSCYTNKQQFKEAIDAYSRALAIDPNYAEAYTNMGSAYGLMKEYDKAIESFNKAISLDPNNATLYFYIGITYRFKGDTANAKTFLDKACQLSPQFCNK